MIRNEWNHTPFLILPFSTQQHRPEDQIHKSPPDYSIIEDRSCGANDLIRKECGRFLLCVCEASFECPHRIAET